MNVSETQKDLEIIIPSNKSLTKSSSIVKRDFAKYWEKEYINERIDSITDSRDKMFIRFLWMTGLRTSEAINIKKSDIDFKNYVMRVKWLKNRKYNERIVPIHPKLKDILELYVAGINLDDKVFSFTRQRAFQIVKQYLGGGGHRLRHSFAVNWLRCGGDLVILHRILGHTKIQTTMEYLKIVPLDQGRELMKISFD